MVSKVEMSLDEIIKTTKIGRGRGGRGRGTSRGRGRGGVTKTRGGPGRGRGGAIRGSRGGSRGRGQFRGRGQPRGGARRPQGPIFTNSNVVRQPQIQTGPAKLQIANLDFGVTDNDVVELFSEFGKMRGAAVHYDRTGRSLGTAHVNFERRGDAMKAFKQYNGVQLDGRPMRIVIEGGQSSPAKPTVQGSFRAARGGFRGSFRGGSRGTRGMRGGRGGGRGGRGGGLKRLQGGPKSIRGQRGGRGRGRGMRRGRGGKPTPPTAEQLDKELDAYVTEATK